MKLTNKFYAAMIAVFFAFAFIACEGPAGEDGIAGADGADGADGKNGEEQCGVCHNSSTLLYAKQLQWEESMHSGGTSFAYAGTRPNCAPCHSGQGFAVWAETGSFDDANIQNDFATNVNCRTCHQIHETYTIDDYALNGTESFDLMGDNVENATVDFGKGNMCSHCHQTRFNDFAFDPSNGSGGEITITSTHWGGHHGPQANVVAGEGGYKTAGGTYNSTAAHQNIAEGCVTCHAHGEANHSFEPSIGACQECHTSAEDFDLFTIQTTVKDLLGQLEEALIAEGLLAAGEEGEMGHPIAQVTTTNDKAGALYNYLMCYEDGSFGVHNPSYVKALLQNSIKVFE